MRETDRETNKDSELLRAAVNGNPDAVFIKDLSGRYILINDSGAKLLGKRPDEVLGKNDFEIFGAKKAEEIGKKDQDIRETGLTDTYEEEILFGNEAHVLRTTKAPYRDKTSRIAGVLGISKDITSQKLAEKALRHTEERLSMIYQREERRQRFLSELGELLLNCLESNESLRIAANLIAKELADYCVIYMKDAEGRPEFFEVAHAESKIADEARRMLERRPPGSAIGANRAIETRKSIFVKDVTEPVRREYFPDLEFREYVEKIGLRSVMIVPMQSRGGSVGTILFASTLESRRYDSSDLEFAEELCYRVSLAWQNFKLYDEAQRSISLRDEFLAIASHELKTPLTPIDMSMQLVERAFESDATAHWAKESVSNVFKVARHQFIRLNRLIDDLLDASRIASGRLNLRVKRVDLSDLVKDIADDFQEQIKEAGCRLEIESYGATLGNWDPHRIEEVVVNLILNAVKFARGKPIQIQIHGDQKKVRLEVRDFGIGIKKEDQKRIFGRFERGVPISRYGGMGLGLFIASQIVEAHGGSMRVKSELGMGSTFVVELPKN